MTKRNKHIFSAKGKWSFFGCKKDDIVKYFFGGNACVSVVVLLGISLFLFFEAFSFFSKNQQSLQLYRQSGQEFSDYANKQLKYYDTITSLLRKIKGTIVYEKLGAKADVEYWITQFEIYLQKQPAVAAVLKEKQRIASKQEIADFLPKDEQQVIAQEAAKINKSLAQQLKLAVEGLSYNSIKGTAKQSAKLLPAVLSAAVYQVQHGEPNAFQQSVQQQVEQQTTEINQELATVQQIILTLEKAKQDFVAYAEKNRATALKNKKKLENLASIPAQKAALNKGIAIASTAEKKQRLDTELARLVEQKVDYRQLNQDFYQSKQYYLQLSQQLLSSFNQVKGYPKANAYDYPVVKKDIKKLHSLIAELPKRFQQQEALVKDWQHDKKITYLDSVMSFFFSVSWITNSSWQDFYGLLPLLTGSLYASIIALLIAIPIAVGGAIYVNKFSSKWEEHSIKPIIEFIGAIPSILFAFLGLMVLGEILTSAGQWRVFAWIPGFPITQGTMILNAGILLAIMTIPTIFTLAEDAINNVPKSYIEASTALGATRMQTAFKIIIPAASSGILSAVLLGFGRVIGETMVVLMVLGGRLEIPTFVTDPAHSMTGIIAQETGEVENGSLHWTALFMVGLVLFTISLVINSLSQKILQKNR